MRINEQYYIDGKIDLPLDWDFVYVYFARRLFCLIVHEAFFFATGGGVAPGKKTLPYSINFVEWCDEALFQHMHEYICDEMERLFTAPSPAELENALSRWNVDASTFGE